MNSTFAASAYTQHQCLIASHRHTSSNSNETRDLFISRIALESVRSRLVAGYTRAKPGRDFEERDDLGTVRQSQLTMICVTRLTVYELRYDCVTTRLKYLAVPSRFSEFPSQFRGDVESG